MKVLLLILATFLVLADAYTLIDPITGRVRGGLSPTIQNARSQLLRRFNDNFEDDDSDLYLTQKARRIPAPEYYAQDGRTPIYKIFRKNPYGR